MLKINTCNESLISGYFAKFKANKVKLDSRRERFFVFCPKYICLMIKIIRSIRI